MKVLQLLTVLVKFGYYDDDEDVKEFLPAIQKLLNGKEDFPTKQIKVATEMCLSEQVQQRECLYAYTRAEPLWPIM